MSGDHFLCSHDLYIFDPLVIYWCKNTLVHIIKKKITQWLKDMNFNFPW